MWHIQKEHFIILKANNTQHTGWMIKTPQRMISFLLDNCGQRVSMGMGLHTALNKCASPCTKIQGNIEVFFLHILGRNILVSSYDWKWYFAWPNFHSCSCRVGQPISSILGRQNNEHEMHQWAFFSWKRCHKK